MQGDVPRNPCPEKTRILHVFTAGNRLTTTMWKSVALYSAVNVEDSLFSCISDRLIV